MRIKLEVDTNPPEGATFETRHLDFPFPSAVCVFDLPSLYAGKLHVPVLGSESSRALEAKERSGG